MNIHSIGSRLQSRMRRAAAHYGHLQRGTGESLTASEEITATSAPIGHQVLADFGGVSISEHDRVLYFDTCLLGGFGYPRKGDLWVDHSDGSKWRIVPDGRDEFWRWHGQTRESIQILCKMDRQ